MLNDILILDQQWLPNQSDFPPISWPWYRAWPSPIMSGFHGAFATGVACQQGTLTLPDTWFRPPFWDLLMLQLLRPNSSNLPCLYSTFHLEGPLVLSRFCLQPYLDLEAGDNQSLKIQVARPGIESRSSCSASQELNHSTTAASRIQTGNMVLHTYISPEEMEKHESIEIILVWDQNGIGIYVCLPLAKQQT